MGITGYLTFLDETDDNLLNNYGNKNSIASVTRLLYLIQMALTYPIVLQVSAFCFSLLLLHNENVYSIELPPPPSMEWCIFV
jgi:amino acid permease